jgi:hypothetical protein
MHDHSIVKITLSNLRLVDLKNIYAFIDADLDIAGIEIGIFDIQIRHKAGGGTSIHLPTHRDQHGVAHASC